MNKNAGKIAIAKEFRANSFIFIPYSLFRPSRLLPLAFSEAKGTVFLIPSSLFLIQSFVLPPATCHFPSNPKS